MDSEYNIIKGLYCIKEAFSTKISCADCGLNAYLYFIRKILSIIM